ncbi:MAG: response regulator [Ruminococcaceae bacterium]|jgi:DNA-binding response OmpR family regulator|nr:response regulator [Oscillospiraceae bacterium]
MAEWIVVVDDDTTNLKAAGHILSRANMRVTALKSGSLLLDYLDKNQPDLILLDVLMPELDGFETMRRLRERPAGKNIPVIFLSASEEEQVPTGLALGAADFIKKPFVPELLVLRVRNAVELDRLRRKYASENTEAVP